MKLLDWLFGESGNQTAKTSPREQLEKELHEFQEKHAKAKAALVDGSHYTSHIETVNQLKREGRSEEAITLLLNCVDATEAESAAIGGGVAPWYYEQLAILYRKERDYKSEVAILERYQAQRAAPGAGPDKLAERLEKARSLLEKVSE